MPANTQALLRPAGAFRRRRTYRPRAWSTLKSETNDDLLCVSKMIYYVSTIKALDHFNFTKRGVGKHSPVSRDNPIGNIHCHTSANPHGSKADVEG
jgi:hypothetical protein